MLNEGQRRLWTEDEELKLKWYIGYKSASKIAEMLGRTTNAIKCKAHDLNLKASRSTFNATTAAKATGYDKKQIIRAAKELKQRWRRVESKKGAYLISEEQLDDIVEHLGKPAKYTTKSGTEVDTWAPKLKVPKCLACKRTKKAHYLYGLCENCYKGIKTKYEVDHYKVMCLYVRALTTKNIRWENQEHPYRQIDRWSNARNVGVIVSKTSEPDVFRLTLSVIMGREKKE